MLREKPKFQRLFLSILIFLLSYSVFLILWLNVKSFYGAFIVRAGGYLATSFRDTQIIGFKDGPEISKIFLKEKGFSSKIGKVKTIDMEISFPISNYSFNVPLTLSLIVALIPFVGWQRKVILESILILVLLHVLYVFSLVEFQLCHFEIKAGFKLAGTWSQFFWEFLWTFVDNMVIRFEPFLIALYFIFRSTNKNSLKL